MCIIASSQETTGGVITPGDVRSALVTPIRARCSIGQFGLGAVIRRALREGPQLRNSSMLRNYRPSRLNGGFQRRPVSTPDPQSLDIK